MGIETFNYIDSLNTSNPTSTDNVSEGDDHIRGIKTTLKNTFPNVNGAITKTDEDLNNAVSQTSSTGSAPLPTGTTAQRDGSPSAGYIRYNTTTGSFEGYSTAWGSIGGGATGGRKNLIINGGFDVWQRGTSFTSVSSVYTADRWKAQFGGNQGDAAQETASVPTGSRYGLKMTATATDASGWSQMGQQIEYKNFYQAVGQEVQISFYAKAHNTNSGSTNITVRTRTNTTEDTSTLFSGANTDTAIVLTTSWVKYTVTRTVPSNSKAWSVEFVMGAFVSGDGYTVAQVQLELGDTATDFEHRSYGEELALCQRYYQKFTCGDSTYNVFGTGIKTSGTGAEIPVGLRTTMRAKPSLSTQGLRYRDASHIDTSISINGTYADRDCPMLSITSISITEPAGYLQGHNYTDYIAFDAEL